MEENKIIPTPIGVQNKKVETYAGDMAKAIESGEGGIIKKMIHEQEEQEVEKKNMSPESKRNRIFLILSAILIFFSIVAVMFIVFSQHISTVSVAPQFSPIIFTDNAKLLEIGGLDKVQIAQTIQNEVSSLQIKTGGIEGIYPTVNSVPLGLRNFLGLIQTNLDQSKIVFVNDNFLLGALSKDTKDLFFLIKVRSVTDIFDPMRAWEQKMFSDMHKFFGVDITSDTNYLLTKDFTDGFISNKNARILYDKDGKIVLMYVFADDSSVVITNTAEAANEVILRLSSSQVKK